MEGLLETTSTLSAECPYRPRFKFNRRLVWLLCNPHTNVNERQWGAIIVNPVLCDPGMEMYDSITDKLHLSHQFSGAINQGRKERQTSTLELSPRSDSNFIFQAFMPWRMVQWWTNAHLTFPTCPGLSIVPNLERSIVSFNIEACRLCLLTKSVEDITLAGFSKAARGLIARCISVA